MNTSFQLLTSLLVAGLATTATADAPLVFCNGYGCGGGGMTAYTYVVDSASYPMTDFRVGTNDLEPSHYTYVQVPEGWHFAIEEVWMSHLHGIHTPHGEDSPGPCWCLTKGSAHWWTDDPEYAIEGFTFGYCHPWSPEDTGWELTTHQGQEEYLFTAGWDDLVGWGLGPVHGPAEPTSLCWKDDHCESDEYCFFADCALETGFCKFKPTECPDIWDPVCGCDQKTYGNACLAGMQGESIDHWGACQGQSCMDLLDCPDPDGMYCLRNPGECALPGICMLRPDSCPEVLDPVCACNGATYESACWAAMAGVSAAYDGDCLPCWETPDCSTQEYCLHHDCDDPAGACLSQPESCPWAYSPVCGCDGETYPNVCVAAAASMSVAYSGVCLAGDFDLDRDVDGADHAFFHACLDGPIGDMLEHCWPADFDLDSDIDLADYQVFQAAFDPPPPADVQSCIWECGTPPPCDEAMQLYVEPGTLIVKHFGATYNCCLDEIVTAVTVDGSVLRLDEVEICTNPCYCICCYDIDTTVVDLEPGTYTVELCYQDYELGAEKCYVAEEVVIP